MKRLMTLLTVALLASPILGGELEWKQLFDGKSFAGWKKPADNIWWTIDEGVLTCESGPNNEGSILWTEKEYEDFILELEFKMGPQEKVDTGVFLRTKAEQIQIGMSGSLQRDMTGMPYIQSKGGYPVRNEEFVQKILKRHDWNTLRIEVRGPKYKSFLNGKHVATYESETAVAEGPIGLQLHGGKSMVAHFRNIRLAEMADQASAGTDASWRFVSFPDFFNFDIPNPKPEWEDAINWWLGRVKAEDPDFVLVAGDLVDGHWWDSPSQVEHLGNVYYGGWVRRMHDHGLNYYVAVGDHELGDDPWPKKKMKLKDDFEKSFDRLLKMPRNGPEGFKGLTYYVKHKGLLLITVETFEKKGNTIKPTVSGKQLQWVKETLAEHAGDVNHIVVQGHVPILPGVKSRSSSSLMLQGGADSDFWQVMKQYGVDLYLCGEHHAITCKERDGIWQIVHGNSWGRSSVDTGNYLLATVTPDELRLKLKQIPFEFAGGDIWNINKGTGPRDIVRISDQTKERGFKTVGKLVIDKSNESREFKNRSGTFAE